jgi:hypothetical protein
VVGGKHLPTHDAYHWLAETKDVNRKGSAPLAEMTSLIHSVTGIHYG